MRNVDMTMFYLEKFTGTFWQPLYRCPERWPLALFLRHMAPNKYRIKEHTL